MLYQPRGTSPLSSLIVLLRPGMTWAVSSDRRLFNCGSQLMGKSWNQFSWVVTSIFKFSIREPLRNHHRWFHVFHETYGQVFHVLAHSWLFARCGSFCGRGRRENRGRKRKKKRWKRRKRLDKHWSRELKNLGAHPTEHASPLWRRSRAKLSFSKLLCSLQSGSRMDFTLQLLGFNELICH